MAKMADKEAYINDFLTIETKIENHSNSLETSEDTTVQDLFETHLKETINNEDGLKEYGIDTYKIKVGDTITLKPSKWAVQFSNKNNLEANTKEYQYTYKIKNIELKMFSRNPRSDSDIPKLQIIILLERV